MVELIEIKGTYGEAGMMLLLLADSKDDELPLNCQDVPGISTLGKIHRGSICITPKLDFCMMANDGTWGPWV